MIEKRSIVVGMPIKHIMQRECATIVIINTEEQKSPGIVLMISSMQVECAKTVT